MIPVIAKSFDFVEKNLRKKSFGVISVIDAKGRPHSTGVIYVIPKRPNPFEFYILTGSEYRKTKYIRDNPNVSFVITFPHYWIRFAPASVVHFQGTAEIIPFSDPIGREAFQQNRIARMNLNSDYDESEMVFIKVRPSKKLHVYGLGISLMDMRSDHTNAGYKVEIPDVLR
ncbi:MAG: pyridoxamine 5'-phosphate oxidase family protein [Candidatus Thorarchaeota archaeon]